MTSDDSARRLPTTWRQPAIVPCRGYVPPRGGPIEGTEPGRDGAAERVEAYRIEMERRSAIIKAAGYNPTRILGRDSDRVLEEAARC